MIWTQELISQVELRKILLQTDGLLILFAIKRCYGFKRMGRLFCISRLSAVGVSWKVHSITTQLLYIQTELLVVSNLETGLFNTEFFVFRSLENWARPLLFVFTAIPCRHWNDRHARHQSIVFVQKLSVVVFHRGFLDEFHLWHYKASWSGSCFYLVYLSSCRRDPG